MQLSAVLLKFEAVKLAEMIIGSFLLAFDHGMTNKKGV